MHDLNFHKKRFVDTLVSATLWTVGLSALTIGMVWQAKTGGILELLVFTGGLAIALILGLMIIKALSESRAAIRRGKRYFEYRKEYVRDKGTTQRKPRVT